ncbi:MAG: carbohydrate kinase family protein [Elusimicrobia bacterium]|nr:carbohydrate kinase family protein [Elusimicrobiota bacterium]
MNVVVAGHICIDITPVFSEKLTGKSIGEILVPGQLINVGKAVTSTGGAVSNTGLVLSKLGAKVSLVSKVGTDLFGKGIIDILEKYDVDVRGIKKVNEGSSSYTVVISVAGIDRIFLHNPGTNDTFGYNDIDFGIVKKAKLFHLGYPPLMKRLYCNNGSELVKIFKKVKSLGVTTSLDMALPDPNSESGKVDWKNIIRKIMPYVDIFLPSFEEILFMLDRPRYSVLKKRATKSSIVDFSTIEDLQKLSSILLKYGGKVIVLKCSNEGLYVRTCMREILNKTGKAKPADMDNWSDRELLMSSYVVDKIASATGSGDASIAGFLMGFLENKTIEETIKCANAAGAQNLRAYDTLSGIGSWSDIQKMVRNKNTKVNPIRKGKLNKEWEKRDSIWTGTNDGKGG